MALTRLSWRASTFSYMADLTDYHHQLAFHGRARGLNFCTTQVPWF